MSNNFQITYLLHLFVDECVSKIYKVQSMKLFWCLKDNVCIQRMIVLTFTFLSEVWEVGESKIQRGEIQFV